MSTMVILGMCSGAANAREADVAHSVCPSLRVGGGEIVSGLMAMRRSVDGIS